MSEPRLALITGASSGIGATFAEIAARKGYTPVLVARRRDKLDALAARLPNAHVLPADLSDPGAIDSLFADVEALPGTLQLLVNNAGFGQSGAFATTDRARALAMVDVNVRAVVDLCHRALPAMLARGEGRILNVASAAAFQPGPNAALYYATKAAVLSFSQALHSECRGKGVTVTALCPGATTTEFFDASGWTDVRLRKFVRPMSAERVAEAGLAAVESGRRVVVPGFSNKFGAFFGRHLPRAIVLPLVRLLQGKAG